jgi:hypothetical protein
MRTTSPGTMSSTALSTKAPSRRTSALSATERRSRSAARAARPSWKVSRPIDKTRMATMIAPPTVSPVSAETMAATSRIRHSGSSRRRAMAIAMPARRAGLSVFGP